MFNITNNEENANQNHNEISPHLSKQLLSKRQQISVGEDVEKREYLCTVGGNANWYSLYGKLYGNSSKN